MTELLSPSQARRARLLLLAVTLLAYGFALGSPFQFDDRGVLLRDPSMQSLGSSLTKLGGLRPLLRLSYSLCFAAGGSVWLFHAFNLLLHLVNLELVLRLYGAATSRELRFPFARLCRGAPVCGLLFALHPLQTEAVTYVTGRSASLSCVFVLLTLLLYAEGARSGRARYWALWAPLAFVAALLAKETSATLPLGLALWELLLVRSAPRAALLRLGAWFGFGALLLGAFIMHPRYFALLYAVLGQRSLLDSVVYQWGGVGYLLERLSLLWPLCIDPGLWLGPPSRLLLGVTTLALVLWLALGLRQLRQRPLVLFGLAWFLLQVFVPYVLLPRVDVINERHAYIANVGVFLAAAALWQRLAGRLGPSLATGLEASLALGLALSNASRNHDYRSEVSLWQSTVAVAPKNPRAFNNLGVAYELAGRLGDARVAYTRSLALSPRYAAPRRNLVRATRAQLLEKAGPGG